MNKLKELRERLKQDNLDGFILPVNDPFQGEYVPEHFQRLTWLTGFSGSAGQVVVLQEAAAFFTDGRYTLQATNELDKKAYSIFNTAEKTPSEWLKEQKQKLKIGFDPELYTVNGVERMQRTLEGGEVDIHPLAENPIDGLWKSRPAFPNAKAEIQDIAYAGDDLKTKINRIAKKIAEKGADAAIITAPDSVCWLLNIRGGDVPNTPFLLAHTIIQADGKVQLFAEAKKISDKVAKHLGKTVEVCPPETLEKKLKALKNKKVLLDPAMASFKIAAALRSAKAEMLRMDDPCQLPKAIKNAVEVDGMRAAHVRDGVALIKLMHWLATHLLTQKVTELDVVAKLEAFRAEHAMFKGSSFDTIAGFASNGAIVHYHANEESNKILERGNLFLLDSGGQYPDGTTDVTRTIAIGEPTKEQKQRYTEVLKGHIALARAQFPDGTSGDQLDVLARQFLWTQGLDYQHGTGHGVGSYLSVHEGPQRISHVPNGVALKPGMVLSNEPGYYKEGEFGIRIESLVVVVEATNIKGKKPYYCFDTLTQVPFDRSLIRKSQLTDTECQWVDNYHENVYNTLSDSVESDLKAWLRGATAPLL
jgi:Xaa-Pro aminopeptidase